MFAMLENFLDPVILKHASFSESENIDQLHYLLGSQSYSQVHLLEVHMEAGFHVLLQ